MPAWFRRRFASLGKLSTRLHSWSHALFPGPGEAVETLLDQKTAAAVFEIEGVKAAIGGAELVDLVVIGGNQDVLEVAPDQVDLDRLVAQQQGLFPAAMPMALQQDCLVSLSKLRNQGPGAVQVMRVQPRCDREEPIASAPLPGRRTGNASHSCGRQRRSESSINFVFQIWRVKRRWLSHAALHTDQDSALRPSFDHGPRPSRPAYARRSLDPC